MNDSIDWLYKFSIESSFARSSLVAWTLTLYFSMIDFALDKSSSDLAHIIIFTPSFAKDIAEANPKPLDPPVTRAFLSFNPKSIRFIFFLLFSFCYQNQT